MHGGLTGRIELCFPATASSYPSRLVGHRKAFSVEASSLESYFSDRGLAVKWKKLSWPGERQRVVREENTFDSKCVSVLRGNIFGDFSAASLRRFRPVSERRRITSFGGSITFSVRQFEKSRFSAVPIMAFSYLAITGIVTALFQFSFFVVAATFKIDKVTDFAGTLNFVILAILTFLLKGTYHFRQVVLTTFVIVWGLRLGIFLLLRILAWGEDKRFDDKRDNLVRFAVFWFLQAVWVWTVHLPVTVVNEVSRNPGLTAQDYVGWAMWGIGMVIEAIADQSKLNFKNDPKNKGKWTDVGLWGWSRHPNYFGEMLLWWGIFVASTPVLKNGQWAVIAGPILLSLLLLFVSGIPLLEASADKRHGVKAEYRAYKNRTSPLIPLPPALYGKLPLSVKQIFLLEFPLYNKKLASGEEQLQTEVSSEGP